MLVNWGLESLKWKILIAKIEKVPFFRAFQAVLTGTSVSMFTPNRTGDYLGRVFILEKANRIEGALLTIIGSISQVLIVVCVGLFSFLSFFYEFLQTSNRMNNYLISGMVLLIPILVFSFLFAYFNIASLINFLKTYFPRRWEKFAQHLNVFTKFSAKELLIILFISALRYLVFSVQFYLLLRFINIKLPFSIALVLIAVIYLIMTVIPTITLTELGIRGSVAVYIIGVYFKQVNISYDSLNADIFTSSSLLWFINLVIPAILGTFFIFRLKFFRK